MVNDTELKKHKIKVYWDDAPENYSKELKNRITAYFSKKYGVQKGNVNVIYRATKTDTDGNVIEISNSGVDNIMDINYQRELCKKWLEVNNKKVDLERLFKLDDTINADVNFTSSESRHRRWGIKWLEINNFLCFGQKNRVSFGRLDGLNLVNSEPENQGGKTTFNIDAIKFLLFGKTSKTDKNEDVFNTFTKENEVNVKGMIAFNDMNVVIERKMTRKEKREGGWTISNKVKYYRLMPDGGLEELNDEDATATTKLITEAVGKEDDFDITTLATANNLEDLIEMKPAMNGKLLNRFIGLEIIDEKLAACRKRYNEFNSKKIGNLYNIITLQDEIEELETKDGVLRDLLVSHDEAIVLATKNLKSLNDEKDQLLSGKIRINDELINVNTTKLEGNKQDLIINGKTKAKRKVELQAKIEELGKFKFDEDKYSELTKRKNSIQTTLRNNTSDIKRLKADIVSLENDEICVTCRRPLDDVDNTSKIDNIKNDIKKFEEESVELEKELKVLESSLTELDEIQSKINDKNSLEITVDKLDVEIGSLRNELVSINNLLKEYNNNKEAIDSNKKIDTEVEQVKTKIAVEEHNRDSANQKINGINIELATIDKDIQTKKLYITKINKEEEVERIFKLYIDMYGKKGIGKMVLKSVLPIINSELVRLMEDVCNFTIELDINHKNDVEYVIIIDGVRKSLKSGSGLEKTIGSLALRAVLGKMAYLPMPNFIAFDEVLGKVAPSNIIKLEDIFNKIKELYDMVFLITHNPLVKDWADNVITVKKFNNVSELNVK
jgi:DNA repair exonuclease SbcCD ATPase subunit